MSVSTPEDRVALLRGVGFFASSSPAALRLVAAALEPVALPAGALLFEQGQPGDALFVIAAGRLRIHVGALVYNELGRGEVVGEMAALDSEVRSASVTALEDSHLLRLDQRLIYQLIEAEPEIARGIIQILCRHLRNRVSDLAADYAYLREVAVLTAAAQAVEAGSYSPELLGEVASRTDPLGQLARVFQHMAAEMIARERRLHRTVQELRIEIDAVRQRRQVSAITASDYFQRLQERANMLRARFDDADDPDDARPPH